MPASDALVKQYLFETRALDRLIPVIEEYDGVSGL